MTPLTKLKPYSKAIAGLLAALAAAAVAGLIPAPYDKWSPVIIALATGAGVWVAPKNTSKAPA